uniref:Uncharacterized protein n=1 Tax=Parascaris univalens TaxID=6257 RepID=A0A915BPS5_PARUN
NFHSAMKYIILQLMTALGNESTSESYYDYRKERSSSAVHAPSDAEEVEKLVSQVYQHASARSNLEYFRRRELISSRRLVIFSLLLLILLLLCAAAAILYIIRKYDADKMSS